MNSWCIRKVTGHRRLVNFHSNDLLHTPDFRRREGHSFPVSIFLCPFANSAVVAIDRLSVSCSLHISFENRDCRIPSDLHLLLGHVDGGIFQRDLKVVDRLLPISHFSSG
jgi:hypothetical protein